jgi:hypothetical protein
MGNWIDGKNSSLAGITRSRIIKPWSVLLYGTEKIGKSTWAAQAPSPVFITAEDGLSEIVDPDTGEVPAHFPQPTIWQQVLDDIDALAEGGHEHKTLVIDTIDWLEPLAWKHLFAIRKTDGGQSVTSIEDYGYAKGYTYALDIWRDLVAHLDRVMRGGMNVILLGHAQVKPFNNPEGTNFDRYTLKVHQKSGDYLKEWVKAILFVNYEILTNKARGELKAKGVGDGARVVHTERRPAFDAGNRYGLPPEMQFDFSEFLNHVTGKMATETVARLRAELTALTAGTALEAMTVEALKKVGNNPDAIRGLINRASIKLEQTT